MVLVPNKSLRDHLTRSSRRIGADASSMVYPDTCEIPPHTKREKKQLLPPQWLTISPPCSFIPPLTIGGERLDTVFPVVHPCRRGAAGSIIDPG